MCPSTNGHQGLKASSFAPLPNKKASDKIFLSEAFFIPHLKG